MTPDIADVIRSGGAPSPGGREVPGDSPGSAADAFRVAPRLRSTDPLPGELPLIVGEELPNVERRFPREGSSR